jgi:Zn-dependent oligopeptidase
LRVVRVQVALLRQALAQQQQAARAAEARATALENTVAQLQRSNATLERLIRVHHPMEGVVANGDGAPRVAAAGELAQAYQRIAELERQVRGVPPRVVRRMAIRAPPSTSIVRCRGVGCSTPTCQIHPDP